MRGPRATAPLPPTRPRAGPGNQGSQQRYPSNTQPTQVPLMDMQGGQRQRALSVHLPSHARAHAFTHICTLLRTHTRAVGLFGQGLQGFGDWAGPKPGP